MKLICDSFGSNLTNSLNTTLYLTAYITKEVECLKRVSEDTAVGSVVIDAMILKLCASATSTTI